VRWTFSVPSSAYTDAFDVREETPPLVISLAAAKSHLNLGDTVRHDEELRDWLERP
jgi:hypothetical protein